MLPGCSELCLPYLLRGYIHLVSRCAVIVARVDKVRFFAADIASGSKFHVSIGHETVMATVTFFSAPAQMPGDDASHCTHSSLM